MHTEREIYIKKLNCALSSYRMEEKFGGGKVWQIDSF